MACKVASVANRAMNPQVYFSSKKKSDIFDNLFFIATLLLLVVVSGGLYFSYATGTFAVAGGAVGFCSRTAVVGMGRAVGIRCRSGMGSSVAARSVDI